MSVIRSLLGGPSQRNLNDPSTPISAEVLVDIINEYGGNGRKVSPETSVQFTAVFRAVSLIAGTVAGLPLKTYNHETLEPTSYPVLRKPNSNMTDFELWELVCTHLALYGNAFLLKMPERITRAGNYIGVRELWPLLPQRVNVRTTGKTTDGGFEKVYEIKDSNGVIVARLTNQEVMHIPGFGYNGVVGLSPIAAARMALEAGMSAEEYATRLWKNGALAGGILQTPKRLDREQANELKRRWQDRVQGLSRAHDIAVLDQGVTFEPLSIPPQDAQFIDTRKFQVVEIARLYGVPPHMLMDVERSTSWGTGIEEQTIAFVMFTIKPGYLQRIEKRVRAEIISEEDTVEFNVEGLLRGSSKTRAEVYEKALDPETGWLTKNEVRELENRPPLQELTEPLAPQDDNDGEGGTNEDEEDDTE